ncbi:MAG: hypothetical protein ACKOA8_04060 [Deltaproteobacteria bacterium]
MPRKKNTESTPTLTIGSEDTQVINSADLEATEAELLSDTEGTETQVPEKEPSQEVEVEASSTTEVEAKPKRQRRSRKNPSAQDIVASEAHSSSLDLSKDVTLAKESIELTMNSMVAQFTKIKELTSGVNTQLEKMNALIKEMSPTQNPNLEELVKPQSNTQFITKFATAASLVAMLLSILSMSMSQSARQTLLSASIDPKENSSALNSTSSQELAFSNKEIPFKKKLKK